jgi:hypothetical protein
MLQQYPTDPTGNIWEESLISSAHLKGDYFQAVTTGYHWKSPSADPQLAAQDCGETA